MTDTFSSCVIRWVSFVLVCCWVNAQQVDFWDLSPIKYSDAKVDDRLAALSAEIADGKLEWPEGSELDQLSFLLTHLEVPKASQILVFSKTSKQISKINPRNPRAVYFSKDCYVGYVPGGAIEVIIEDPLLGPVFYLIGRKGDKLSVMRDRSDCLSCHGTSRTENVPGVFVRSVFPDSDGQLLLGFGSETVDHKTPIEKRWGGYYVTGISDHPHLGNLTFHEHSDPQAGSDDLQNLDSLFDTSKYLQSTSDIVALAVLEHQCAVQNLLTAARMRYLRASYLSRAINPESNPDKGPTGDLAKRYAERIVDALLFKDEASLGEGIEGDRQFQSAYAAQFPKTADGESLADFKLYKRLFKNRCSCMIYSSAFDKLPKTLKLEVLSRLENALDEENDTIAPHLSASEKKRIKKILHETLKEWAMVE